jgi:hypothetical protein
MDINFGTEAGANFDAPIRETGTDASADAATVPDGSGGGSQDAPAAPDDTAAPDAGAGTDATATGDASD